LSAKSRSRKEIKSNAHAQQTLAKAGCYLTRVLVVEIRLVVAFATTKTEEHGPPYYLTLMAAKWTPGRNKKFARRIRIWRTISLFTSLELTEYLSEGLKFAHTSRTSSGSLHYVHQGRLGSIQPLAFRRTTNYSILPGVRTFFHISGPFTQFV